MVPIWKLNLKCNKSYETKMVPSDDNGNLKGIKALVALMEAIVHYEDKITGSMHMGCIEFKTPKLNWNIHKYIKLYM